MKKLAVFFLAVCLAFTVLNIVDGVEDLNRIESAQHRAVDTYGRLAGFNGKNVVYGSSEDRDVYRLSPTVAAVADIDGRLDGLYSGIPAMNELADECGADFLFVFAPYKQFFYQDIEGSPDKTKEKYAAGLEYIKNSGVDFIDMVEFFNLPGVDPTKFYYSSDHHWNTNGAFICYSAIAAYFVGKGYNFDASLLVPEYYDAITYESTHLGSAGRFAGRYFGGYDDVTLMFPKAETELAVAVPSEGTVTEGSFADTIVHYENLDGLSFDKYGYYAYFGTDKDYIEVVNRKSDGPRVVVIKDSMAVPVNAFLSLQCSELDIVDLRYVESGAAEYIKNKQPDVIIGLFGTGSFGDIGTMTP